MPNTNFQKAKDCLIPEDIYLRDISLRMNDSYEPKYDSQGVQVQYKKSISKLHHAVVSPDKDESFDAYSIFRVFMDLGVRLLPQDFKINDDIDERELKKYILAELTSLYVVEYKYSDKDLGDDADTLIEFAERNSPYHIWPFWRELIMSTFQRANIPKFVLPTFQIKEEKKVTKKKSVKKKKKH